MKVLRFGAKTFVNAHIYVHQLRHLLAKVQGGEVELGLDLRTYWFLP